MNTAQHMSLPRGCFFSFVSARVCGSVCVSGPPPTPHWLVSRLLWLSALARAPLLDYQWQAHALTCIHMCVCARCRLGMAARCVAVVLLLLLLLLQVA
jgi:hypothetical protein